MNRRVEYIQNTSARDDLYLGDQNLTSGIAVVVDQKTLVAYTAEPFHANGWFRDQVALLVLDEDLEAVKEKLMKRLDKEHNRLRREFLNWPWKKRA